MEIAETRFTKTRDGATIAYQTWGDNKRTFTWFPYLFGHIEQEWDDPGTRACFERLGSFARVVHFDKRGSGLSDPYDRAATLDERMDDARAVLDAVGAGTAYVGGQSEGGPLAILFAATYPERTDGLVLINSSTGRVPWFDDEQWIAMTRAFLARFEPILEAWGQPDAPLLDLFCPSRAQDDAVRRWAAKYSRSAMRPAMVRLALEVAAEVSVWDILPTIQVPTLVIHVARDRLLPVAGGAALAKEIPNAEFVEIDGDDHTWWMGPLREEILDHIERFVTGIQPVRTATDRTLATVVLTDIVGSTATLARVGDSDWRRILDSHDEATSALVDRYDGRRVKSTGDGLLATFDSPGRALDCTLDLRKRMTDLGLDVRAGVHTGEIELRGSDVGGMAVHLAARIESQAAPGEILTSRTVKDLVAGSPFRFETRGAHSLKGIEEEWELFAVAR